MDSRLIDGKLSVVSDTGYIYNEKGMLIKKSINIYRDDIFSTACTVCKEMYYKDCLVRQKTTVECGKTKTETTEYYDAGRLVLKSCDGEYNEQYFYNASGELTKSVRTDKQREVTTEYSYVGSTVNTVISYSDTTDIRRISYIKDSQGRKTKQKSINPYNEQTVTYFIYDIFGNLVLSYIYDNKKRLEEISIKGGYSFIYRYDNKDRLCRSEKRDINSMIIELYKYEYDAAGNICREVFDNGRQHEIKREYAKNGNLISKIVIVGKKITSEYRYEYDSDNNLIKELITVGGKTAEFNYCRRSDKETIIEVENPDGVIYDLDLEGSIYC